MRKKLEEKMMEFRLQYSLAKLTIYLIDNLINSSFLEAAFVIDYVLGRHLKTNDLRYYFIDVVEAVLFRLTSEMAAIMLANDFRGALNWGWFIARTAHSHIRRGTHFFRILKERVNRLRGLASKLGFSNSDIE